MKTLITRALSGIVFLALVIGSVGFHFYAFAAVFAAFTLVALYEYEEIRRKITGIKFRIPLLTAGFMVYLIFLAEALWKDQLPWLFAVLTFIYLVLTLPLLYFQKRISGIYTETLFGITYIALPFSLLLLLPALGPASELKIPVVLSLLILLWTYDTFAYLVGILIGRHKLAEKISPKKTWEGAAGGALFCLGAAWLLSIYAGGMQLHFWLLLALIVIVAGTAGDLFESALKRKAGIKDSGNIMPGHGGILDRFDALLFIMPFVFLFFYLIR